MVSQRDRSFEVSADDAARRISPMTRQSELTKEIARLIAAAVDGERSTVVYDYRMLTTLSQSQMTIELPEGQPPARGCPRERSATWSTSFAT